MEYQNVPIQGNPYTGSTTETENTINLRCTADTPTDIYIDSQKIQTLQGGQNMDYQYYV